MKEALPRAPMKEAKLHIKKEVQLIRILVISSFVSTLFFSLYGHWYLFPTFNDLIISLKEKEAVQIGHHITNMIGQSSTVSSQQSAVSSQESCLTELFKQETVPGEIADIIAHSQHDFGILKVKVFNADGLTIYSTEEKDIGVLNRKPYFHNQVAVAIEKATLFREVKELSLHDALTGLPNRRLMENFLQQTQSLAIRYKRNFSLIMTDIDHFKNYNDTHGHAAGNYQLWLHDI